VTDGTQLGILQIFIMFSGAAPTFRSFFGD
jgi:hypothetical protein